MKPTTTFDDFLIFSFALIMAGGIIWVIAMILKLMFCISSIIGYAGVALLLYAIYLAIKEMVKTFKEFKKEFEGIKKSVNKIEELPYHVKEHNHG